MGGSRHLRDKAVKNVSDHVQPGGLNLSGGQHEGNDKRTLVWPFPYVLSSLHRQAR
jgi:hypothetical protein